ncbi:solute carrier family 2, facilitated glucose transporter member 8-like [Dendronephthya gigantea]|uniref:solute carrier family 2, facilitated glucose transporter member 8-like n=1 Tax=Dendronephthya gigantea TaxID=151771 RepID=UPI00106B1C41|nr:solute carrier family 2, facilitated glucose transporter member 8-like [Dendronephthya gigantea]
MLSTTAESVIQSGEYTPLRPPERPSASRLTRPVVLATLTACLGAVSFGFVLGYVSPVENDLKEKLHWSDEELTWFTSIQALGCMLGALIGLKTIDKFGRKFNIMACSVPLVAGWIIIAAAKALPHFYVGRFISGLGVGAISLTVPLYIAEISPAKYRGALGSANQLGVTFGALLAYSFGSFLNWHWLAIAGAIPSTIMAIFMIRFPETPRWLIRNGRINDACHALEYLRQTTDEECEDECKEIRCTLDVDERVSLREFTKPTIYRPFIISIMLMVFQQFSGINAVIMYASQMLRDAGLSDAIVAEIAIGVVQFVGTGIACLIIDKLGRRVLLIFPTILMCVSMAVLGAADYYDHFPKSVTLIALCCFITGFSFGFGPIPWLIMSEIFPTNVRGIASGIATQVNWLGVFIVTKFYVNMKHSMHPYGMYWFFAAVCLVSVIYVFIFLPETKGKTLEEVQRLFAAHRDLHGPDSFEKYGGIHS